MKQEVSTSGTDRKAVRIVSRLLCLFASFVMGFVVYMVEAIRTSYDGFPSIFILPLMATVVSGAFVLIAFLVGLILLIEPLKSIWTRTRLWAAATSSIGLLTLVLGYSLGLRDIGVDPETGSQIEMLHPAAAVGGYFLLLFGIANVPVLRNPRDGANSERAKAEVSVS